MIKFQVGAGTLFFRSYGILHWKILCPDLNGQAECPERLEAQLGEMPALLVGKQKII